MIPQKISSVHINKNNYSQTTTNNVVSNRGEYTINNSENNTESSNQNEKSLISVFQQLDLKSEINLLKEENILLKSKVEKIDKQEHQIQMLINEISRLKPTSSEKANSSNALVKGNSGEWQNNQKNIFYTNDSGAVSINTEDIYTLKPFSLKEIIQYSDSNNKNVLAINEDCNYIFIGIPEENYVQQYKRNDYSNLFEKDGTYDGPYGGRNGPGNFGCSIDQSYPFLIIGDTSNSIVQVFDVSNGKKKIYDFSGNPNETSYGYDVAIDTYDSVKYSFLISDIEHNNIYSAFGINSISNPNIPTWSNNISNTSSGTGTGKSLDLKYYDQNLVYMALGAPNSDFVEATTTTINSGTFDFQIYDLSNSTSSTIYTINPPIIGENLYFGSNIKLLKNSNLICVGGPGANQDQGNIYLYDVSLTQLYNNSESTNFNDAGNTININYITDLSQEDCILPIIGSKLGNVMDFTYNPHDEVYTFTSGISDVGLLYNFSKNKDTDTNETNYVFDKNPIIFSADRTDISFGNSIAYQVNPNKNISILGIGAEVESQLYLYYNTDTIFNVYQNAFIKGSLEVEKSINCYSILPFLGNQSNGFELSCWIVTNNSLFPLSAFSFSDFNTPPYNNSVFEQDLGYYVYPTFKIELYTGVDYGGNICTIDNSDGTELVVYMMNANSRNQLGSMKVYQNNNILIDNPYLVQTKSENITNPNFEMSYKTNE